MEKENFSFKRLYKEIIVTAFTIFFISVLSSAAIFYSSPVFAQIGLAPIPTFQKVLPTYIIDIPPGAVLSNKSSHYVPEKISIPVGTTIAWFNDDPGQTHTVTSGLPKSPDSGKVFNSGVMPEGSFYQFTFNNPADYRYHCILHPWMAGTIHVSTSYDMGHYFKFTSGAKHLIDNGSLKLTINKTQYDRTLLDFKPLNIALDTSTPVIYNFKINNGNGTVFNNNFQVLDGKDLQIELISSNVNNTNVYGPDVTDPITGAYHVEGNFADGNYKLTLQLVSKGSQILQNNITDQFALRFVS